jgi:hypothetical protein
MQHLLYKTTNLINNKYYYGIHSTENTNDSYLGSGVLILRAIEKHGKENFKREILNTFETRDEALIAEHAIVDPDDENSYNIDVGGNGTGEVYHRSKQVAKLISDGRMGMKFTEEHKANIRKASILSMKNQDTRDKIAKSLVEHYKTNPQSEETKQKRIDTRAGYQHSEDTKRKISEAQIGKVIPEDQKKKMSEAAKNRKTHAWTGKKRATLECPKCGKVGADFLMKRWHFDNCKWG